MLSFWAAFSIGLLGSLHCVGMCGPIAAALPYPSEKKTTLVGSILLYNSGRVITYSFLGLLFGIVGAGFSLGGFQQFLSVFTGVLLLVAGIFSFNLENGLLKINFMNRFFFFVKSRLARFLQKKSLRSLFFIGTMNGLLPCGLVYVALAGALSAGSIGGGVFFMMFFGLGTIPLMILAALSGSLVSLSLRRVFQKIYPVVMVAFAVLLIMRGLNVEIPEDWYFLHTISGGRIMCH